mmetsp:Transcript_12534/g.26697  ORF Transcript_12534/g.26697 Transcript_12534/m.26697 type:complete len:361 (-) Transcript_12534:271-1353(-)
MTMVPPTPPLVLPAALAAATLILQAHSLQIKPTPPPHPPKSLSSRSPVGPTTSPRATWSRGGQSSTQKSSTTPMIAYTVADHNKPWIHLLNFHDAFSDLVSQFGMEDSLFSFEGGGSAEAAVKPYMPNLEMEAKAITATEEKGLESEEDLLLQLNTVTKTCEDLQSSMNHKSQLHSETIKVYETKIGSLEEKNALLEKGLKRLTVTLENQGQKLIALQHEKDSNAAKQEEYAKENEMLRQRLRHLEVELSDIAFESRKTTMQAPPATKPAMAAVEAVESSVEAATSVDNGRLSPKAPTAPVPSHILKQRQTGRFLAADQFKLFGVGFRRGMTKVGKTLHLWSPLHNLLLWGELRGQREFM